MTRDYRALCAALVKLVERCPVTSDTDWICDRNELIVQFHNASRALLSQPTPGPPTDLEDAISVIESCAGFTDESTPVGEAWSIVCAALSQSAPKPPTDEALYELWISGNWYNEGATLREFRSIARAVLARWGQS